MKRHRAVLSRCLSSALVLGMGALLYSAWTHVPGRDAASGAAAACTCALERGRSGWCEACAVGYVADVPIRSKALYDALDAHGHDIDGPGLACAECRAAFGSDGFCPRHGRGFVGGRAYLSRLAYHVARGERASVREELELLARAVQTSERCDLCAAAMVIGGFCPRCRLSYEDGRSNAPR